MTTAIDRKKLILKVMRERLGPIWAGDVSSHVSDQEKLRTAFKALVREGAIKRVRGDNGNRAYYWFAQ